RLHVDVVRVPWSLLSQAPLIPCSDGRKMSKSHDNTIELAAEPDEIRARVRSFVTDPQKIRRGDPGRPEICPIFALHQTFSPGDVERVEATCRTGELGCVDCKSLLADHLIQRVAGFRERRAELAATPGLARDVLAAGIDRARPVAIATLEAVRAAMHFEG